MNKKKLTIIVCSVLAVLVVGLLVNRYKASATSGANLIRSQKSVYAYTQADQGGAAYAKVFQGGMTFVKD